MFSSSLSTCRLARSTVNNVCRNTFGRTTQAQCGLTTSAAMKQHQPAAPVATEAPKSPDNLGNAAASYSPTGLEKKYLVWSGKYKSVEQVPEFVHREEMEKAQNKVRIRGANIMMLLTLVGCIAMVVSGKNAAEQGTSVQKQNLEWHKQYNEQSTIAEVKK